MRMRLRSTLAALALVMLVAQGCILIPEIQKRVVELAVGGSATQGFVASGELNVHDQRDTVDISTAIDLPKLLSDAGIDISDVKDIKLAGVYYRVTQQDPTANRQIQNGTVTIQRGLNTSEMSLVSNFNVAVNDPANATFQAGNLASPGVGLVNQLLTDMLTALKAGLPLPNSILITHVNGTSSPGNVPTNFKYELRIDLSIVGTVHVDVPN
jgi:hypothetical protein